MTDEKAAWLMKEHRDNVTYLDKIYDDEMCRQKLVLEEKLANRRALAEMSVRFSRFTGVWSKSIRYLEKCTAY